MKRKNQKSKSVATPPSIKKIVFLLAIVIIISSVATVVLLHFFDTEPDEVKTIAYDFTVKDKIGIVLDNDALHFGGGPHGVRLQRAINLTTTKDATVKVSWEGDGNIVVSENDFFLAAGDSKSLIFYVDIPEEYTYGLYEGLLIFSFYR